jgi:hypothetical protein
MTGLPHAVRSPSAIRPHGAGARGWTAALRAVGAALVVAGHSVAAVLLPYVFLLLTPSPSPRWHAPPCAGGTRQPQHRPREEGAVVAIVRRQTHRMYDVRRGQPERPDVLRPHRTVKGTPQPVWAPWRETPSPCSACIYVKRLILSE